MTYASHIINRLPAAANEGKTPLESRSPTTNYDSLCIFGCPVYYHVKDSKLDPRAKKTIFLGFGLCVKGYRLWCTETKKIFIVEMLHLINLSLSSLLIRWTRA